MTKTYFTPRTFGFLSELAANNNRQWFLANKSRYESDVKEPALRFISDFSTPLEKISPRFRADPRPNGGSLFRIYRDVRFSKDKTPYKTAAGIQFRHEAGRDAHAPGFYLHVQPGRCFVGCGSWRPGAQALRRIRAVMDEDPRAWKRATGGESFRRIFELSGDSLVRAPLGYSVKHPLIEDLRRKDFVAVAQLGQADLMADDFLSHFASLCSTAAPFQRWLCRATGVSY